MNDDTAPPGPADDDDRRAPPPATGRRRYLSILFSDLSDSTRLAAAMEAEHYAELLAELRAAYRELVPRHGGIVVRIQGDGMLAIFGYPDAREDDGRRATEAALDLHERVRRLQLAAVPPALQPLALHSGIHAGLVLVDEGDLVRGRFELLGHPPNIAARLSETARKDQILVSEETLGPERHFFRTAAPQQLVLRGAPAPVSAMLVLARAAVHTRYEARAQRGLAALVGRAQELATLHEGRVALRDGRAGFFVVAAPPGMGKTRLCEALLAQAAADGCLVLRGYCESYLSAEPLQPFRQMLRALRPGDGVPAAAAPALKPLLEELRTQLEQLAAGPRRAVMFIDDWQWADDASRQLLGQLRALAPPMLVLLSARGVQAGDPVLLGAQLIELGPLGPADAAEAIARLLPGVDPFVAATIRDDAGGNPLYIEELCHSAARGEIDGRTARGLDDGRPARKRSGAWLDALVESRVARLPSQQIELLRVASVIGNVVPAWLLERLTGFVADDPELRALAEQDFLYPDTPGHLRFKHGITRDAVYRAVGLRQRESLHLRIAAALAAHDGDAQHEFCEALAYHFGAAGQPLEAARFAEQAGDRALAASALDRAQAHYRAALAALDSLPPSDRHEQRWTAVVHRLGLVCAFDPSRDHLDVLQRAVSRAIAAGDALAQAKAELWLGYVQYGLGDSRLAARHCERAIAAADAAGGSADAPLRAQMHATLGQALHAAGRYVPALPLLDEAIAAMRPQRAAPAAGRPGGKPAVGLAYTLACRAALLGDRGDFSAAQAGFDDALEVVRGAQHEVEASVLGWRSLVYGWQGRWAEALQAARDAQQIAERAKSLYIFAMDHALAGQASWALERTPAALQAIVDATGWLEGADRLLTVSLNHGWLAQAWAELGDVPRARHAAAKGLQRARVHDRLGLAMLDRALARLAMSAGQATTVERHLARARRTALVRESRHELATTQLLEAQWAVQRGERARADALIDAASASFDAMRMHAQLAQAAALRRAL